MRILICLDFDKHLDSVLQAAKLLLATRVPQPEIDILHVIDTRIFTTAGSEAETQVSQQQQSADIYTKAREYLGSGIRYLEEYGIPQPVIDETMSKHGYDLVITGTRGRSLVGSVLLGSLAEHLLHEAKIPLLIVP